LIKPSAGQPAIEAYLRDSCGATPAGGAVGLPFSAAFRISSMSLIIPDEEKS